MLTEKACGCHKFWLCAQPEQHSVLVVHEVSACTKLTAEQANAAAKNKDFIL
tara:strand:+ start:4719 stop:4874 length:156 start_codon:yes stop_codon:yes gene_type:complete